MLVHVAVEMGVEPARRIDLGSPDPVCRGVEPVFGVMRDQDISMVTLAPSVGVALRECQQLLDLDGQLTLVIAIPKLQP